MKKPAYLAFFLSGALLIAAQQISAQTPQIISYQGRVVVGATNFDGTGKFKFVLVNNANGATLWSNDGTSVNGSEPSNPVALEVSSGLYSVLLGDSTVGNMLPIANSVFNNSDVRLRVWFDDAIHGSQLLSPDQRVAAVGYAMMASTVPDGSISAAKLAPGAVGSFQLAPDAAAANLNQTLADPSKTLLVGRSTLFPDLNDSPWIGSSGAKLTIEGTELDKPSLAIVGDYRTGNSGERYSTVIYSDGGYVSNSYISLSAHQGHADSATSLTIQTDVPVAMSLYSPYNADADGTLISGWGIPTAGPTYTRVFHVNSQGTLRLVNPYGHTYHLPQMILRATDAGNPDSNDFAIRTLDGSTLLGTWNDSQAAFKNSAPWTGLGEIRLRPGDVDVIANVFKTYGGIQVGDGLNDPGTNNIAVAGLTGGEIVYADSKKKLTSTGITPANIVRKDQAPKFAVYNAEGQTISSAVPTRMTWDGELFDTNGNFSSGKFMPSVAGKYLLTAGVTLLNVADGAQVRASVYKNGVEYAVLGSTYSPKNGSNPAVGGNVIVDANGSTDFFELYVYQNSGNSRSTLGSPSGTYFQGALLP